LSRVALLCSFASFASENPGSVVPEAWTAVVTDAALPQIDQCGAEVVAADATVDKNRHLSKSPSLAMTTSSDRGAGFLLWGLSRKKTWVQSKIVPPPWTTDLHGQPQQFENMLSNFSLAFAPLDLSISFA
jgi:hypothetical protein